MERLCWPPSDEPLKYGSEVLIRTAYWCGFCYIQERMGTMCQKVAGITVTGSESDNNTVYLTVGGYSVTVVCAQSHSTEVWDDVRRVLIHSILEYAKNVQKI